MTTHTVIESLAAYEAVRAQDPGGERVWWTTSPYLLMRLPALGETVRSPEAGLPQEEFDGLALAGLDLADSFCSAMSALCPWAETLDLGLVFGGQLSRCFFVTLYKGLLLDRVQAAAAGAVVECVGDPEDPGLSGLSLVYGRMDTLFARLAANWPGAGCVATRLTVSAQQCASIEREISQRRFMAGEKFLSLLNNTPSSALYKLWRKVQAARWWPFRGASLWPFPRRTLHVLRDCELIEEAFLGILLRGGRILRMPPLPRPDMAGASASALPEAEAAADTFRALSRQAVQGRGLAWRPAFEPSLELVCNRILACLDGLRRNASRLEQDFSRLTDRMKPGDEILSISFNSPLERLFAGHCRKRGIRVNVVDHGVTLGLSEWSLSHAATSGMGIGERAFYHCARGVLAVRPHVPEQQAHEVGLPGITSRPPLRPVQRRLARRLLGLGQAEHVVMVVCDLDRNNYMYGPCQDNDLQFLTKTRQTAEAVCRAFPASRVVLKLYPTQRYLDEYAFADLQAQFSNLSIVKGVEFRFIRTAADLLFTSSVQSTLGWVSGAGAPYFYLDFAWAPGRVEGLKVLIPGIDGLAAAIMPDAGQVCSAPRESLAAALFKRGRS
ncbi:MAG: hypothetical protein AB1916_05225 [Thermodesulfobacteriota bacterium]